MVGVSVPGLSVPCVELPVFHVRGFTVGAGLRFWGFRATLELGFRFSSSASKITTAKCTPKST